LLWLALQVNQVYPVMACNPIFWTTVIDYVAVILILRYSATILSPHLRVQARAPAV
jgi:hypothetical protein